MRMCMCVCVGRGGTQTYGADELAGVVDNGNGRIQR